MGIARENLGSPGRLHLLDGIRGLTLLSMILYHAVWDLVVFLRMGWDWYTGPMGFLWQQSICCTFILLSGFCWPLGKKPLKRGLTLLAGGAAVSAVTWLAVPWQRVQYGVLTLLGLSMLLLIPLNKILVRVPPAAGLAGSLLLFLCTYPVSGGFLGVWRQGLIPLPDWLYQWNLGALIGFPPPDFLSTDYFPLLPWFFLFLAGYFLFPLLEKTLARPLTRKKIPLLSCLGRHSLLIYLLHQPVLYLSFSLFAFWTGEK